MKAMARTLRPAKTMDHCIAWVCHHTDRVGGVHTCGMWLGVAGLSLAHLPPHRLPTSLTLPSPTATAAQEDSLPFVLNP
jgi:hypothetical protein